MTVSVMAILWFICKALVTIYAIGLTAVFFCWPINDQPTTKIQIGLWLCSAALIIDFMFVGLIEYTL